MERDEMLRLLMESSQKQHPDRCSGVSPDGGIGCLRPRYHESTCKNMYGGEEWCWMCDQWACGHVDPLAVMNTAAILEDRRLRKADA